MYVWRVGEALELLADWSLKALFKSLVNVKLSLPETVVSSQLVGLNWESCICYH